MRRIFLVAVLWCLATGAQAASTIVPNLLPVGIPPNSGLINQNFQNAINDVNALQNLNAGVTAPSNPSLGYFWLSTPQLATTFPLNLWDGTRWANIASLDSVNHIWMPPIGGGIPPTILSATTTDLGSVPQAFVYVSGTNPIQSFGASAPVGTIKVVDFTATVSLVYNASSLILPGQTNLTALPGDVAIMEEFASGSWLVVSYSRASGGGGGGGGPGGSAQSIQINNGSSSLGGIGPIAGALAGWSLADAATPITLGSGLTLSGGNVLSAIGGGISTPETVTATGTTQATATALSSAAAQHFVTSGSNLSVALPVICAGSAIGRTDQIIDQTGSPIAVYPINGGVDAIAPLPGTNGTASPSFLSNQAFLVSTSATFRCASTNQWVADSVSVSGVSPIQVVNGTVMLDRPGMATFLNQLGVPTNNNTNSGPPSIPTTEFVAVDQSGGGLSFTCTTAQQCGSYTKTNGICQQHWEVQWPTTSDTNQPVISGPPSTVWPSNLGVGHYVIGNVYTHLPTGPLLQARLASSGDGATAGYVFIIKINDTAAGTFNNSTLSGLLVYMDFAYPC